MVFYLVMIIENINIFYSFVMKLRLEINKNVDQKIYNAGPVPLKLHPGTKVCQLIFQRCEGKAKYKGRFKSQKKP